MQTSKKKPSVIFILVGAILAGYFGYLIGGAWEKGMELNDFINRLNEVCSAPLTNYMNENTVKAVAIARKNQGYLVLMAVSVLLSAHKNNQWTISAISLITPVVPWAPLMAMW